MGWIERNKIDPADPRLIRDKPIKRWYKWGVCLCNWKWPASGGHTHWLADRLDVDYLYIGFKFSKPRYSHCWYDGQHHTLSIGFAYVEWGGAPYHESDY